MKKVWKVLMVCLISLGMVSCKNMDTVKNPDFFPTAGESFIGDPMPYFDGEKMHIFFLEDLRDGAKGYHPWSKLVSEDFVEYEHEGVMLPFIDNKDSRELALGTGSVIKVDNLYYAFYTAHNPYLKPKEIIMRAVSEDLVHWDKDELFTLNEKGQFNMDDFRDPYVLYNEEEELYWMLITTRFNDDGVINKYTSRDLDQWEDDGILYNGPGNGNLECPSLLEFSGKWYLSYSEQWPNRVVRYLVSDGPNGPFKTVGSGVFDSEGFYAGRLEKTKHGLVVVGWTPTKNQHMDRNDFDWAGNMVIHELVQADNSGVLVVKNIEKRIESMIYHEKPDEVMSNLENVKLYDSMKNQAIIEGKISFEHNIGLFGFTFNSKGGMGNMNIVMDVKSNQIKFYNVSALELDEKEPQLIMDYDFSKYDDLEFEMVVDGSVIVLYVNEEVAFSTRIYRMSGKNWGIFSLNNEIDIKNLKIHF